MSLGQGPDETLFWSNDYDWFNLGTNQLDGLIDHFERFLADCRPDVVNFHHVMGFGVQALRSARRALGDVPIVYTLHEYLPICANHGQMIKARSGALCSKASRFGVRGLLSRGRAGEPDAARAVHQELPRRG